jgi:hypothetical protein
MSPSELEEYFLEEPVWPLRLTLASGDQIMVGPNDRPFVSGLTLVLTGSTKSRLVPRHRLVSIPNIVLAEPLEARPGQGRRRRAP